MVAHNGLMRIFWPSDAPRDASPGVLVGFRNSESDVLVVTVLQEVEVRRDRARSSALLTSVATACRKCSCCWDTTATQSLRCPGAPPAMWAL